MIDTFLRTSLPEFKIQTKLVYENLIVFIYYLAPAGHVIIHQFNYKD